ncbi:MAG: PKD domain-containing protein [Chitinophagales bacterium]
MKRLQYVIFALCLFAFPTLSAQTGQCPAADFNYQVSPQNLLTGNIINVGGAGSGHYSYHWVTQSSGWGSGSSTFTVQLTTVPQYICVYLFDSILPNCYDTSCKTIYPTPTNCPIAPTFTYLLGTNGAVTFHENISGSNGPVESTWIVDGSSVSSTHFPFDTTFRFTNGLHQVCLQAVDSVNCQSTTCQTISINNGGCALHANYTYTGPSNGVVVATATQTGASFWVRYGWKLDGVFQGTSTTSPAHTFNLSAGVHNVCLYAYDSLGCVDSICRSITVPTTSCSLHANYTYTGPSNGVVVATATQTGASFWVHYGWKLDGVFQGASTSSAVHTFNLAPGVHNICLFAYDSLGCVDSICRSITATPTCQLNLNFSTINQANGMVLATASQTGAIGPVLYQWYADGVSASTLSAQNNSLSKGFTNGTHYICLYAYDSLQCFDSICKSVTITNCNITPQIVDSITGITHHLYAFAGVSGGLTYHWSNGATTNNITTTSSGTYCVTVSANSGCIATACKTVNSCNLQVTITDSLSSAFHQLKAVVNVGGAYTYAWSNGITTATNQVTAPGTYCVTVTNSQSGCSASACQVITPTSCTAAFTRFPFCDSVQFFAMGSGLQYSWSFGDGTSSNISNPSHTYHQSGTFVVKLRVFGVGCIDSSSQTLQVTTCPKSDTICGTVFLDNNGNGIQDTNESGIGQAAVYINSTVVYTDASGHYSLPVTAGTYHIYHLTGAQQTHSIPAGQLYYDSVIVSGGGWHCGYNYGVQNNSAIISGIVYYDNNNNNVYDAGDAYAPYKSVQIGNYYCYTNSNGFYSIMLAPGSYTVSVPLTNPFSGYTVNPASISVVLTAGQNATNNNFALHPPVGGACNAAVSLVPHTTVTPGRPAWYNIYVNNYGNSVVSGTILFAYDPVLHFNYISPAGGTNDAVNHTYSINYSNLAPGHYLSYFISLRADSTFQAGYQAFGMASITANCNESSLTDNIDTVHQTATASWDPNNKLVTPEGKGAQGYIATNQELQYQINFQNTGSAPAVNVVIHDQLPTTLDLNTLRVLGASHPYALQLNGNLFLARFSDIMLPDSTSDEVNSHGWISFKIKPVAGLQPGTEILNGASIFFDYNEGVVTNVARNTIEFPAGIESLSENVNIVLQPNPFHSFTTLKITGANDGVFNLVVTDLCGRVVQQQSSSAPLLVIDRNDIATGTYLYSLTQSGRVIAKGKLMAE